VTFGFGGLVVEPDVWSVLDRHPVVLL